MWNIEETGVNQCRPVQFTLENLWSRAGNKMLKRQEKIVRVLKVAGRRQQIRAMKDNTSTSQRSMSEHGNFS